MLPIIHNITSLPHFTVPLLRLPMAIHYGFLIPASLLTHIPNTTSPLSPYFVVANSYPPHSSHTPHITSLPLLRSGHLSCAKALINLGARRDAKDFNGDTAYQLARKFKHTSLVNYLFDSEDSSDSVRSQ